jgi:hypothetical protein
MSRMPLGPTQNVWSYTSPSQYIYMACLIKHRDDFTFMYEVLIALEAIETGQSIS